MKHILIDARESGTSTGRYVDKLIEHLHGLRPDYRVTLLAKPHRLEFLAGIAPGFQAIASPHKEFTFAEQLGLKSQIESLKPDLVHFTMVQQPVLYRGPTVTTMHDLTTVRFRNPDKNPLVFTLKQQIYKWVNRQAARKAAAVITPTEYVKRDVVQFTGIDPAKVTVTYEAANDLPLPAQPVDSLAGLPFIMYLGRPTPHKNLERLIQAFQSLKSDRSRHPGQSRQADPAVPPDLHLVLAGKTDANYQRIADSVKQQGIANVVFTGFTTDNQLRWLYEHCQAYIFPSLSEGFGLPALEAMRHGAPVVSSNATCLPEVYGRAALYFDPLDVQDVAAKITTMLTDQGLRQDYIRRGRAQADAYSWRRMAEQTLVVYGQTLRE